MRIVGVDLPENKPIWIALTAIYGVGPKNVVAICQKAQVDTRKRARELSHEEVARLAKALGNYKIEGDLRREIGETLRRLKEIGSYRGIRHLKNLPVRGQRTRTNARTKRGKRVTIGALKKETLSPRVSKSGEATVEKEQKG